MATDPLGVFGPRSREVVAVTREGKTRYVLATLRGEKVVDFEPLESIDTGGVNLGLIPPSDTDLHVTREDVQAALPSPPNSLAEEPVGIAAMPEGCYLSLTFASSQIKDVQTTVREFDDTPVIQLNAKYNGGSHMQVNNCAAVAVAPEGLIGSVNVCQYASASGSIGASGGTALTDCGSAVVLSPSGIGSFDSTDIENFLDFTLAAPTFDSICRGTSATFTFELLRDGGAVRNDRLRNTQFPVEIVVDNLLTGGQERATGRASMGDAISLDVNLDVPQDATLTGTTDVFEVRASLGEITEQLTLAAAIVDANLQPRGVSFRPDACVGRPFANPMTVANDGSCPAEVRGFIEDVTNNRRATTDGVTVAPGGSADLAPQMSMPVSLADADTITVRSGVQRGMPDGAWETIDEEELEVRVLTPNFQVTGTNYPSTIQPGSQVNAGFTIQNAGGCVGEYSASGSRLPGVSGVLEPGETARIPHSFEMPVDRQDLEVAIRNETLGEDAGGFGREIGLRQVVDFRTGPPGRMAIFGGFGTRIPYNGTIYGTNIGGERLEEADTVAGVQIASFAGSVEPSGVDVDAITFANVNYLFAAFAEEVLIAANQSIEGRARQFEYNATPIPSSVLRPEGADPDISIRPNPLRPRDAVAAVAGALPIPTLPFHRERESAFD